MKINIYQVNSFAKIEEGGNPAGVVLNADSLSEKEMRRIAAELGLSETAFVMKSKKADYKLRFFTPNAEVDLCGHATIGAFYAMASLGAMKPGIYTQETKAGVLGIEVYEDHSVMMDQKTPIFSDMIQKQELSDSLHIRIEDMSENLPAQVVSTGLRDILIPVKNTAILNAIRPDFEKVKKISQKYNAVGYHVFTPETLQGATASCRNFAPLYDIDEEAATGTSSGALGCYLYRYGKVDKMQASEMIMEQGSAMGRLSEIRVVLIIEKEEITGVKVGGSARNLALYR
ncbi:MAG: PhzF family phenazine biosynthesis protein [Lachnospiraceae bacterium]